jgi:nucleotide-binding universal stress UspA family protein
MEQVVIGIDGERASQVAVDWVIKRAQQTPLHVALLEALDTLTSDSAESSAMKAAHQRFVGASPDSVVDTVTVEQSILEGLAQRSQDADLLVIGSHPGHSVRSMLTGTLPLELISRTGCALVVVPDDWTPGGTVIVVGVDDDDSSDEAVAFAAAEAETTGVELLAVHSWRPPSVGMEAMAGLVINPEQLEQAHSDLLSRVMGRIAEREQTIRAVAALGPIEAVLESQLSDAALLVLGSHGHGPILGGLLGSTVQHLLHKGKVPIAVVRNGARWAAHQYPSSRGT